MLSKWLPVKYKKIHRYKYQLVEDEIVQLSVDFHTNIVEDYVILNRKELLIKKGYCWDGASGPTFDTKATMRASLIHDALYQLIKLERLPMAAREIADDIFHEILIQEGVPAWRANTWYWAVRNFGRLSLKIGKEPKIITL